MSQRLNGTTYGITSASRNPRIQIEATMPIQVIQPFTVLCVKCTLGTPLRL